jgi:hypothetical protein
LHTILSLIYTIHLNSIFVKLSHYIPLCYHIYLW